MNITQGLQKFCGQELKKKSYCILTFL